MSTQPMSDIPVAPQPAEARRVAIICSKGGLDECYPALILANAARMAGIEAFVFFTFYGLDVISNKKVDHLHVNMVGNPSSPMPTMVAGLPGMESFAAKMMKSRMEKLDLPTVREMLEILDGAGAKLYGCELAMNMMGLEEADLIPEVDSVITAGDFYEMAEGAQIIFT